MDVVGELYRQWEREGKKGLLFCMDVKGGYKNVGVEKMEERLEGLGMEKYLRKWVSSFLREREVKVKLGKRKGRE
ncbi:hypothetical protein C7212DRAFT_274394 [Tuber magnatum]|uniref:Reverse transcriptase domain-containing protein n=1 Tax=Tuber magnatum TaxID=42249 RepID=A0A317T193_9PEZI|nr:hypothetical protein C7212DRAFT_274394 [Tuber magnatum]